MREEVARILLTFKTARFIVNLNKEEVHLNVRKDVIKRRKIKKVQTIRCGLTNWP